MKLDKYQNILKKIGLFQNFTDDDYSEVFKNLNYKIIKYSKDSMIFIEGRECNTLNIILGGNLRIQKIDPFGKTLVVVDFNEGDIYGETLLFAKENKYPMTGISTMDTTILYIPKDTVLYMCRNDDIFLTEFLKLLSEKSVTLSSKLNQISLKTIRQKICEFILLDYNKNKDFKIRLNMTKSEWADIMGVQRPSLSRELLEMKKAGLIDYDYNYIYVKDIEGIETILISANIP